MADDFSPGFGTRPDILPPGFAYALIGSTVIGLVIWALALIAVFVGL